MYVLVQAMSLQICFCLFGSRVGGEMFLGTVCTVPALWLFLTEIDGVCVLALELCMWEEHREKKP